MFTITGREAIIVTIACTVGHYITKYINKDGNDDSIRAIGITLYAGTSVTLGIMAAEHAAETANGNPIPVVGGFLIGAIIAPPFIPVTLLYSLLEKILAK